MSQEQLACRAGCSQALISKLERGTQQISNTPLTGRLAQLLGTTTVELLLADSGLEDQSRCIKRIKLALTSRTSLSTSSSRIATHRVRDLEIRVEEALEYVATGAYRELSVVLPRLIRDLDTARERATNDRTVKTVLRLLAEGFLATSEVMNLLHEHDVAVMAANQAIIAGKEWGDLVTGKCLVLRGHSAKVRALLESGYLFRAREASLDGMPSSNEIERLNDSETVDAVGSWLLVLAGLAMRTGNRNDVGTRLDDARKLAQRASEAHNNQMQTFTTTTVAMSALRLAVEIGNGALALDYSHDETLKSLRPQQQADVWIDVARAHLLLKSPQKALAKLLGVEKFAPDELIKRGTVVVIVDEIAGQVADPYLTMLHDFANRLYGKDNDVQGIVVRTRGEREHLKSGHNKAKHRRNVPK